MNKKKIIFYAGVLVVVSLMFVSPVSSIQKANSMDVDEDRLLMRLQMFERIFYNNYKSIGCNRIYDVNRDHVINFQDAGLCWSYAVDYDNRTFYGDLLYDVNCDGQVNFQDAGLCWVNRD